MTQKKLNQLSIQIFEWCVKYIFFYDFRDKNGYYQITGRVDDVINVTGHRLGTAEVEDVMVNTILFSSRVIVTICLKLYSEFFKNSL